MLRRSFLPPIPEYTLAANLLSDAADALLAHNYGRCAMLLKESDLQPLRDFAYLLAGPINPEIHRQTKNPAYPRLPKNHGARMPSAALTKHIFGRDGWHCRFCESRVISKQARQVFCRIFPVEARWGRTNPERHFGLSALTASLDHLLPFRRGGTNDHENLVTACGPCQFGRNQWTLEEVEIEDPRNYTPIVDHWDGLSRLIGFRVAAVLNTEMVGEEI